MDSTEIWNDFLATAPTYASLSFTKNQIIDGNLTIDGSGFIQPSGDGSPQVLLELTQDQINYLEALPDHPTNYVVYNASYGPESAGNYPNTAFVMFPIDYGTDGWKYSLLIPLDSTDYQVYYGTWYLPLNAFQLVDWG